MNTTSRKTQLKQLEEVLLEKDTYALFQPIIEKWSDYVADVQRAIKQFKANQLIVVVTGQLKAGKSTLVNLLANNEKVSPVGTIDTTLRPALITLGKGNFEKEGGIEIYLPKEGAISQPNDDTLHRKQLKGILDHLRLNEELRSDIEKCSLSELYEDDKRLKEILCTPARKDSFYIPREPLLVVIHVPRTEQSLLREPEEHIPGIMLLDMPGLDSGNMEENTGKVYSDLLKESDMVLFLQSSVAPLNKEGIESFNKHVGQRGDLTAWIIHNKMEAKNWLKADVRAAHNRKQIEDTKKELKKYLSSSLSTRNIPPQEVNLGMAYDSRFSQSQIDDEPESLFVKSGFKDFQDKIRLHVNERGGAVREQHCLENLNAALKSMLDAIDAAKKKQGDKLHTLQELRARIGAAKETLDKWEEDDHDTPLAFLKDQMEVTLDEWPIESILNQLYIARYSSTLLPEEKTESYQKGSWFDDQFSHYSTECCETVNEFIGGLNIWQDIQWSAHGRSKSANRVLKESFDYLFKDIAEGLRDKYIHHSDTKEKLNTISGFDKVKQSPRHQPFKESYSSLWDRIFSGEPEVTVRNDILENTKKSYISSYIKEVKMNLDKWYKNHPDYFSDEIKKELQQVITDGTKQLSEDINTIEKTIKNISTITGEIEKLKKAL